MKPISLSLLLVLSGCAALTAEPWAWLDDPGQQSWVDVSVRSHGRVVSYSVPTRSEGHRERPRIWPPLEENGTTQRVRVPLRAQDEPALTAAQYIWDEWWGGFGKGSGHDFSLNVQIEESKAQKSLLEMSLEERLRRPVEYRRAVYSKPDSQSRKFSEYFFTYFRVEPFRSETGITWIKQNDPAVTSDHVYYTIPITDRHILEFSFFVRDKRFDWKDDPEWNARRWALVEQIMNTVRITPDPLDAIGHAPSDVQPVGRGDDR